jgi:hypothetical protein
MMKIGADELKWGPDLLGLLTKLSTIAPKKRLKYPTHLDSTSGLHKMSTSKRNLCIRCCGHIE